MIDNLKYLIDNYVNTSYEAMFLDGSHQTFKESEQNLANFIYNNQIKQHDLIDNKLFFETIICLLEIEEFWPEYFCSQKFCFERLQKEPILIAWIYFRLSWHLNSVNLATFMHLLNKINDRKMSAMVYKKMSEISGFNNDIKGQIRYLKKSLEICCIDLRLYRHIYKDKNLENMRNTLTYTQYLEARKKIIIFTRRNRPRNLCQILYLKEYGLDIETNFSKPTIELNWGA